MKNIISIIILMLGLFVTVTYGTPVVASSHPELVSSHPELVSGPSELVSSHPELVSGSSETTISATASSTIKATLGEQPVEKENFFLKNWGILLVTLLGCADVVTRLTPTEKDNSILNFITSIINAIIPNLKKGGGRL